MMSMTKNKITLEQALELLAQNQLSDHYEIEYTAEDKVEATDAIKLGALGIDVPEQKIYYDDDAMEEDEEFAGEWIPITSDLEDYKRRLTLDLNVDEEIMEWLSSSDIDIDLLVSELLTGFYRSTKVIEK